MRTLSGCCLAFSSQLALPKLISIRSVLDEMRLARDLINNSPRPGLGAGTSCTSVSPVLKFCRTCFINLMGRFSAYSRAHVCRPRYAEISEQRWSNLSSGNLLPRGSPSGSARLEEEHQAMRY